MLCRDAVYFMQRYFKSYEKQNLIKCFDLCLMFLWFLLEIK